MKQIGYILEGLSVVLGTPETNLAALFTVLYFMKVPEYTHDLNAGAVVVTAD